MLEIEQKFAHADFAILERHLADWGATGSGEHLEADQYFNAPDRDFAKTGEAFRLRRRGEANFLTFKGPKQAAAVKTRTELEIPLRDGDEPAAQMTQLLEQLGYRPVAVVTKRRREYPLLRQDFHLTICLDEVVGLGRFAEVEILAPQEQSESARQVIQEVAAQLELHEVETRSYLTMILQQRKP